MSEGQMGHFEWVRYWLRWWQGRAGCGPYRRDAIVWWLTGGGPFRESRRPQPDATTALARALFDVGLTSIGPDDLDNRQIAERLIVGGYVRVLR